MLPFLAKFYELFLARFDNPDIHFKFKIINTINVAIFCAFGGTIFTVIYVNEFENGLWIHNLLLAPPVLLTLPIMYFSKNVRLAIHYGLFAALVGIGTYTFRSEGILSPGLHWLLLIPIVCIILLDIIDCVIWTLIIISFFVLLYYHHYNPIFDIPSVKIAGNTFHILASSIWVLIIIYVLITLFVTQSKHLYKEMEQTKIDYESLAQIISHDISNPLSIVNATMEMFTLPPEDFKSYDRIKRSGLTIKEIITKVRDLRKLDSGKKHLKVEPIDIMEVINHINFIFQDRLKDKKITLNYYYEDIAGTLFKNPSSIPLKVMAEPITFRNQVISNLISNSIKYSNEGSEISLKVKKKNNNKIEISVSDEGIGIPKELIKKIFSVNKETNRLGTRGEKGTGFGMLLVKRFIEKYKGTIHVESRTTEEGFVQTGTLVRITLDSGE